MPGIESGPKGTIENPLGPANGSSIEELQKRVLARAEKEKGERASAETQAVTRESGAYTTQAALDRHDAQTPVWGRQEDPDVVARARARRKINNPPIGPSRRVVVEAVQGPSATQIPVDSAPDSDPLIDQVNATARARHEARGNDSVEDIVNFDFEYRAHHDRGTVGRGSDGKLKRGYMSNDDLDEIKKHQDTIRAGLSGVKDAEAYLDKAGAFRHEYQERVDALKTTGVDLNTTSDVNTNERAKKRLEIMRAALVAAGVDAAVVGNLSDDEMKVWSKTLRDASSTSARGQLPGMPPKDDDTYRGKKLPGMPDKDDDRYSGPPLPGMPPKDDDLYQGPLLPGMPDRPQDNPPLPSVELTKKQKKRIRAAVDAQLAATPGFEALSEDQQNAMRDQLLEAAYRAEGQRLAHVEALREIDDELEERFSQEYEAALSEYAQLKADNDTKGWVGRQKRTQALMQAEENLLNIKLAHARKMVKRAKKRGLYEGDDETVRQLMAKDMFNKLRELDGESRRATDAVLQDRIENRSMFERGIVSVGRFFNRGRNKFIRGGKNVLVGAGVGVLTALGISLSGVGFPITTGIGAGLGYFTRTASRKAYQDELLAARQRGEAANLGMTEEQFAALLASVDTSGKIKDQGRQFGDQLLGRSREQGLAENKDTRKKASKRTLEVMGGYALGNLGTHLLSSALDHHTTHSAKVVGDHGSSGDSSAGGPTGEHSGTGSSVIQPGPGGEAIRHINGLDSVIRPGEGGQQYIQNFLHANGINVDGRHALAIWDKITHDGVADIFSQNGTSPDTYAMVGQYGGHSGLSYAGRVVLNPDVAQRILTLGRSGI